MSGANGSFGAAVAVQPFRLTVTPAMIRAGGTAQTIIFTTAELPASKRLAAVRWSLSELFDFTIADPAKTITITVFNDGGDVLFTLPLDVAHGTITSGADLTNGTGALPLVVGPYAQQGLDSSLLQYIFNITTDAAALSLVKAGQGALWVELVLVDVATTVTVSPIGIPS